MSAPTAYYPAYSFTQYQQSHPSTPLPAAAVDSELFAISTSITEIVNNLVMIQNSDGTLANQSVGFNQLQAGLTIGLTTPATNWLTGTAYTVNNVVYEANSLYICAKSHTSGVFATDLAAGDWVLFINTGQYVAAAAASATAAAASATSASTSATNASTSATAAATSAAAAAASASGMTWRPPVQCTSTSNITLSGLQAIDGYTTLANDRVLVQGQSTPANNGIYVAASGAWSRATDANSWAVLPGLVVAVENGTVNADYTFICTVQPGGTLGSTPVTFGSLLVIPAASSITSGMFVAGAVNTAALAANAVTLAKMATQGANTVLVNATGGAAVPTAVALSASTLLGMGTSGNAGAMALGTGFNLVGGILNYVPTPNAYQAQPSNPTGTTNTTQVMMGLAGAITPAVTGTIMIMISGDATATSTDGYKYQLRYGTGSAPANGAALTGTAAGSLVTIATVANKTPFSTQAIVTGLTPATAYWFDLALAAVTAGTASVLDISLSAFEIR